MKIRLSLLCLVVILFAASCSNKQRGIYFCETKKPSVVAHFDRLKLVLTLESKKYYIDDVVGNVSIESDGVSFAVLQPFDMIIPNVAIDQNLKGTPKLTSEFRFASFVTNDTPASINTIAYRIGSPDPLVPDSMTIMDEKGNVKEFWQKVIRNGEMKVDVWHNCGNQELNFQAIVTSKQP